MTRARPCLAASEGTQSVVSDQTVAVPAGLSAIATLGLAPRLMTPEHEGPGLARPSARSVILSHAAGGAKDLVALRRSPLSGATGSFAAAAAEVGAFVQDDTGSSA